MKKEVWKWLNDNKDIYPFKDVLSYISKLETQVEKSINSLVREREFKKEISKLQKDNKELNLENQAFFEILYFKDENMLARRYEKLQKENEKLKNENKEMTETMLSIVKIYEDLLKEN